MPTKNVTIELAAHELEDQPPALPPGATRWERQELRRLWGNALRELQDTIERCAYAHRMVRTSEKPTSLYMGNAAQSLAVAAGALAGYGIMLDAIHHRQIIHGDTPAEAQA